MDFIKQYLSEANEVIAKLDTKQIEKCVELLAETRETKVVYLS